MEHNIISIGALGGSGTRAIAEVLIQAGVYMGDDLNGPNDNLIFTRLFKNPQWYKKGDIKSRNFRLDLFRHYMENNKLSYKEIKELQSAARKNHSFPTKSTFYLSIFKKLLTAKQSRQIWGWKEPNTQIYCDILLNHFKELKYVHVLRNGLDMAFSKNKQQLNNWGWKYNITLDGTESDDQVAVKQLDYWIASTKDVIEKLKNYPGRYYLLNHSNFCLDPKTEINNLLDFCQLKVSPDLNEELYLIPEDKGSNNRYLTHNLSIFDPNQLQYVQDMGFNIPISQSKD